MATRVYVNMQPIGQILERHGLNKGGRVQQFLTMECSKRMTDYMPFRSGALATKLKVVTSATEITVYGPYARYQYYGKAMVGPAPKRVTDKDLTYDKTKNPKAGPFWDRRMMAEQAQAIANACERYLRRGG